ncbi:MAG: hypothetical protein O3C45_11270 [Bacteroidetes bacterium]|nr:hypothetical protein [Bacteroidota bacterium]MDA0875624.1 hypothetical protein [Bacteroidota bacterium]
MRFLTPFLLAGFVLLSGCTSADITPLGPGEKANRDSILVFLDRVGQEAMTSAFGNLESFSYRRYLRTEQYDGDDFLLAFTEHIIETSGPASDRRSSVTQADSGGAFDFGFFNQFVSENVDDPDPVDLVPWLLEENPSYLSPRNLDKYTFRATRDTLMWDRSARIIEVRARPELADGENIRKVRYYVDRISNQLVAMYLERIDLGLLFREESTFYMHVQPVEEGVYVPYNTRFQTAITTPFKGSYRIRTVSTYTDRRRLASAAPDSIQ